MSVNVLMKAMPFSVVVYFRFFNAIRFREVSRSR
jgi:hypothetical protein